MMEASNTVPDGDAAEQFHSLFSTAVRCLRVVFEVTARNGSAYRSAVAAAAQTMRRSELARAISHPFAVGLKTAS
jgi:hypothetical protein